MITNKYNTNIFHDKTNGAHPLKVNFLYSFKYFQIPIH